MKTQPRLVSEPVVCITLSFYRPGTREVGVKTLSGDVVVVCGAQNDEKILPAARKYQLIDPTTPVLDALSSKHSPLLILLW